MKIQLVVQKLDELQKTDYEMAEPCTVAQFLKHVAVSVPEACSISVYGVICKPEDVLKDMDRVEICVPILIDPKKARQLRAESFSTKARGRRHAN